MGLRMYFKELRMNMIRIAETKRKRLKKTNDEVDTTGVTNP